MTLSKTWKIEKALLDDIIKCMEEQEWELFSKEAVVKWLNIWYREIH